MGQELTLYIALALPLSLCQKFSRHECVIIDNKSNSVVAAHSCSSRYSGSWEGKRWESTVLLLQQPAVEEEGEEEEIILR